ncbi:MAG TPA: hypothetical protein DCR24_03045 [Bacillus bacterium]|nr:hypothetical protein [Bacillus sp. (in: firmicutes)]
MEDERKVIFGSWAQAAGTTLSAIGSTPLTIFSDEQLNNFNLWGNVMQATGNSLIADSEETLTLGKIGNDTQAIGNLIIVAGILLDLNEFTKQELDIKGNLLQAAGGSTALAEAFGEASSFGLIYNIYGNSLQVIGNSMQAIAGIINLRGGCGLQINTAGSWIQAIGSILQAIGQSKNPKI